MNVVMTRWLKAVLGVAGLALAIGGAEADGLRPALTSFGANQGHVLATQGPAATFSIGDFSRDMFLFPAGTTPRSSFAASLALSPVFALDSGYNIDITQRFSNFDALKSPLLPGADFLSLANGGNYAGATWMLSPSLDLRAGAALKSNRLDHFSFDSASANLGLPAAYDSGGSRSFLAGLNWNVTDWGALGVSAIANSQSGAPYGINPLGNLASATRIDTNALDVAAGLKFGNGWVTTASYAEGFTQLDRRAAPADQSSSYSIAIAKHGVFGDDALGFSFSHPTPGVLNSGFDSMAALGDLPPVFVANGHVLEQTPETDLQLGYVSTFLDGALDLQANAAYQMNYQGQTGATSLSVLSRAKIKF